MRLSINLDQDVYSVAKSLAKAEDCSVSAAINRLVRRSFETPQHQTAHGPRRHPLSGFPISLGSKPITAETVRDIEEGDDLR